MRGIPIPYGESLAQIANIKIGQLVKLCCRASTQPSSNKMAAHAFYTHNDPHADLNHNS